MDTALGNSSDWDGDKIIGPGNYIPDQIARRLTNGFTNSVTNREMCANYLLA